MPLTWWTLLGGAGFIVAIVLYTYKLKFDNVGMKITIKKLQEELDTSNRKNSDLTKEMSALQSKFQNRPVGGIAIIPDPDPVYDRIKPRLTSGT
jgi:hypothetical protein